MQRKLLIASVTCILSGTLLLCLWAVSWYALNTGADSVNAQTVDSSRSLPLPQIRQAALFPTRVATSASVPRSTGTSQPMATPVRPAPGNTLVYRVQPGDTLFSIALNFEMRLETLVQFNDITDPDKIWPGQELVIPGAGLPTPTRAAPARATSDVSAISVRAPIPPAPGAVNGIPVEQLVAVPTDVKQNIRKIYAQGQALGNDPRAFSKIGDSNMENPYFLAPFDDGSFKLGEYAYLAPVINYFAGSFGRQSTAVRIGFHSWSVLDEAMADKATCWPNETPVACELRLHRPSIALIRLGTNDAGYPERLHRELQALVELCVQQGVIPIMSTKADRVEGPEDTNNNIIRQIAAANHVPVWDFDLAAKTLPDSGLGRDHVHLTVFYPLDYTLPEAFQHGHSVDNLIVLIALDRVLREIGG